MREHKINLFADNVIFMLTNPESSLAVVQITLYRHCKTPDLLSRSDQISLVHTHILYTYMLALQGMFMLSGMIGLIGTKSSIILLMLLLLKCLPFLGHCMHTTMCVSILVHKWIVLLPCLSIKPPQPYGMWNGCTFFCFWLYKFSHNVQ